GIDQHGRAPATRDGVVKRIAHVRRNQDVVAGADSEPAQGQLERHGSRRDGGRVLDAETLGERALERGDLGALGESAAADDASDGLGIGLGERGPRVRDQMSSSSRTDWNASAYFTRAWIPRKFAHETASSRIVRSSMLVFATCERCASRHASLRSSTFSMLV